MAIQKDFVLPSTGTTISYWRITQSVVNHVGSVVDVYLSGYISQAAREDGRDPAFTRYFRLTIADLVAPVDLHAMTTAEMYEAVIQKLNIVPTLPNGQPGTLDPLANAANV